MKFTTLILIAAIIGGCTSNPPITAVVPKTPPAIAWQPWSDDLFVRAKRENKLVLLDLEAVWCHWCHVQDETTYKDETVRALLAEKYIAVKVDQDSRPDISAKYEDWGWPATIVFDPNGNALVKRRGYIPPKPMASQLQAIIDDPTPGPSVVAQTEFTPRTKRRCRMPLAQN